LTPSLCGRLDQICALLPPGRVALLKFVWEVQTKDVSVQLDEMLKLPETVYLVLVNLQGSKNTIKILASLQDAARHNSSSIRLLFGKWNEETVDEAAWLLRQGMATVELGKLATVTQQRFDEYAAPLCPSELFAPRLHVLLANDFIRANCNGGKAVGAGGDGTALLIVQSEEKQRQVLKYLGVVLGLEAWPIKLN
jgi:galactokinase